MPETCSDGAVSLFGALIGTVGEITVNGTTVCGLGDTEVIYDIGNLDSMGNFVPAVLSAFSQMIAVIAGTSSCFQLALARNQTERTLSVILSTILVQVMDAGRNVRLQ